LYGGTQVFGDAHVCATPSTADGDLPPEVLEAIGGREPRRILSIPYFADDVLTTLALKVRFRAPLCTYIMDDQNIVVDRIPDASIEELLRRSDVRFGISRDLCEAYEAKFGFKFWFLPAVVPAATMASDADRAGHATLSAGALVGNIWSQGSLDRLRAVTRESGVKLDWYGDPVRQWLSFDDVELARDGIALRGYVPQDRLSAILRQYPYVVVPIGSSDAFEDRPELARLSLPSRLPYLIATANVPIVVVGRDDGAAARFVEQLEVGVVCPYDPDRFRAAVARASRNESRARMRDSAARVARVFSAEGIEDWIWASLARGEPADSRFEELMPRESRPAAGATEQRSDALENADVIITPNEVNDKHGTGVLVRRLFKANRRIVSLRSFDHYGGDHQFGEISVSLHTSGLCRADVYRKVGQTLRNISVRRVLCVPYFTEDVLTACAVKDICGVPLAAYLMDDQNVAVRRIADALMQEFLAKCSLRLVTHPELRDAYEKKFGMKFWLLPAVVPSHLIDGAAASARRPGPPPAGGALLGSLWSQRWYDMLWHTVRDAGVALDWYGHRPDGWCRAPADDPTGEKIVAHGLLSEERLAERLRRHRFVVVPTSTLDERDDRPELALSLPGRIIFAMATAHTPILVMGSPRSAAARFVQTFGIGQVCDYEAESFARAVEHLTRDDVQRHLRDNAARSASQFSDAGIRQWIWDSLDQGEPADQRFEQAMPRSLRDIVPFIEPPTPSDVYWQYAGVFQVMRRLALSGVAPDFVIDAGASHGIWSHAVSKVFPRARFVLIDPLIDQYEADVRQYYVDRIPNVQLLALAVSNRTGRASFRVSTDLYGSSLLHPADFRDYKDTEADVDTLDNVARRLAIQGRGVLKLDVQCAEHLVLDGARQLLERIDVVVAETSLVRYDAEALVLGEMLPLLEGLGFRYYDETGAWRSPVDGTLLQKEIVFVRHHLVVPETSRRVSG
jgi:FkbM family methyltransferase